MPPPPPSIPTRLTITPSGSLGVKTQNPTESLDVVGNAVVSGHFTSAALTVTGHDTNSHTRIQTPATFTAPVTFTAGFTTPSVGHAANLGALQVSAAGSVGIGTSPPPLADGIALDIGTGGLSAAGPIRAAGSVTAGAGGFIGDGAGLIGFAASARTDTTNAANITSGTLETARLPSRLPAAVCGTVVGIGCSASAASGGPAPAPRLDIVGEALTMLPCPMPPAPMTAPVSVIRREDVAAEHLAGTYTASASTESPHTAAWYALDADATNVWQSVADYTPAYTPSAAGGGAAPITTRDDQNVNHDGHYIQLATQIANSAGLVVTGYELTAGSSFTAPASWVLLGSAQGNTWTVLDRRVNQDVTTSPARFGIVGAPAGLTAFRLVITKTAGGNPATPARAGLAGFRLTTTRGAQLSVPLSVAPAPASGSGLFVAPNGAVGIGTTAPTAGFHVAAEAGAPRFGALGSAGGGVVAVDADGTLKTIPYGADDAALIPSLVRAIQELTERLERLEQR